MKNINKVAVLGAGVMGSALACHMANSGLAVLLLDIVPKDALDESSSKSQRDRLTNAALKTCIKSKPAPLYSKSFASRIETGNLTDDLHKIEDCDWILEVIIERLDIKQDLYARVEKHRKAGTLISSNTSGIPIAMLAEGRSEDFKKNFFGTHFFNPPRYLPLLEIIPGPNTDEALIKNFEKWAEVILGKNTVRSNDTAAFIANRIGVFAMSYIYKLANESDLPISTIDKLTGKAIGRPSTGTFRLSDLVGLDVAMKVTEGIQQNCPTDKMVQSLEKPSFLNFLMENKFYGNKTKQGFYLKTNEKDENGKKIILELDLKTNEYVKAKRVQLPCLSLAKQIDNTAKRIRAIYKADDKGAALIKNSFLALFAYASQRIPEVTDEIYNVDTALRNGFGWSHGPFELWDIIGLENGIADAEAAGFEIASWVKDMLSSGQTSFYQWSANTHQYYNQIEQKMLDLPIHTSVVHLRKTEDKPLVYTNDEVDVHDIGDGVLCLEFKSKMNAIGEGILTGITDTIQIAEEQGWKGIVIGNKSEHFSVGANLMMVAMFAYQQQYDMLGMAVKKFQDTAMRCRYSDIPIVAATQGYVFGGSCEIAMHCDAVAAASESYIGLVEVGVGIIPGGGGTKEFALRVGDSFKEGDVQIPSLINAFKTIATANVATSAYEAFENGTLLKNKDFVVMNKAYNIGEAKRAVLQMAPTYQRPMYRKDVQVLGREGLGALYVAANELKRAGYASEHDIKIARKLAYVLCGGDLSQQQAVSEQYLLDLEREAFLSLCTEQKTLERIQHMLEKGKPLRN